MTPQEKVNLTKYDLLFESRLSKVEATLDNVNQNLIEIKRDIKSDFRWLFGLMIVFSGSLLGVMAKGFHWL